MPPALATHVPIGSPLHSGLPIFFYGKSHILLQASPPNTRHVQFIRHCTHETEMMGIGTN